MNGWYPCEQHGRKQSPTQVPGETQCKICAGTPGRVRYSRGRMCDFRRKKLWVVTFAVLVVLGVAEIGQNAAKADSSRQKKNKAAATPTSGGKPSPDPVASGTPSPTVAPEATPPDAPPLTAEQMASAVTLDSVTVPTPGEFFAALNKQCKPNWTAQARGPITTAYSDRAQAALNLGGLIADGYISVEAMDGQQVKNLGRDILSLAKNLGISKGILDRGESIKQFADDNDWHALKEEREPMQDEVKQEMDSLHDDDLITLLSIGAWIRGTYVVTDVVLKNFNQNTSCILRQPALIGYLQGKIDRLSPRLKDTPLMKTVNGGVADLGKLVSFPLGDTPSKDDVQKLHDQAGELLKAISKKDS